MVEGRRLSAGRSSVITLAGAVVNAALAFVVAGTVSNALGAASTGFFFQGVAMFTVTAAAVMVGADTAMVRTASRLHELGRTDVMWRLLIESVVVVTALATVVAVAAWIWADDVAGVLVPGPYGDELGDIIRALAPFLPFAPVLALTLGTSRGLGQILPFTAVQNTGVPSARVLAIVVAVGSTAGVSALVIAWAAPLAAAAVVAAAWIWVTYRRSAGSVSRDVRSSDRREFWGFALPRGGAALVERALEWLDVLIVLAVAGPAAGGVYAILRRLTGAGGLLESTMRIVTGPMISRAFARGDRDDVAALFREGSAVLLLLSGPLYLTLAVFGVPILSLFGAEFTVGATALAVLSGVFLAEVACGMLQSVLLMGGKSHWQLQNKLIQLGIVCVCTLVLVPLYGLVGAAAAWGCGALANVVLSARRVWSLCGVRPSLRVIALPSSIVAVSFGLVPVLITAVLGRAWPVVLCAWGVGAITHLVLCHLLRHRLPLMSFRERQ